MDLNRRRFLVFLPAAIVGMALPRSTSTSVCQVEIELKFPRNLTREEYEFHFAKMQNRERMALVFADLMGSGRMKMVKERISETHAIWNYEFATLGDVRKWINSVRTENIVDKSYMDGSFKWVSRLNGKVVRDLAVSAYG